MKSLWDQTVKLPAFRPLDGDLDTDILIIGGGIAGILCAYMLHRSGADYVLCEADAICSGITKNTTAKITSQHGLLYDKLIREFGTAKAKLYWKANEEALQTYRALCREIDCDFSGESSFVYSLHDRGKLIAELSALRKLDSPAQWASQLPLPFPAAGAVEFPNQAQFHPLKFISAIARDLHIYEHTRIQKLIGTTAVTRHGTIRAGRVIVATHFPFLNRHGSYFLKLYQDRSYVIALKNAPGTSGMYVDAEQTGLSFRRWNDLLLLGGGSHRTGKSGGSWAELRAFAQRYYPNAEEVSHWAAQDCMTLDGAPYIGPYSASTRGLYVATGFNKWGMTSSMAAATLLCDLLQGKENPYTEVFSPSRTILRPQLAVNAFEAAAGLLTPTTKRCPHLGCALKWNPVEHTWDCSCHGSRFTAQGRLIDNPATGNRKP